MRDKKHRFALYMEGIRVPCSSATINTKVDGPAVATITLVPTEAAFYAPERTLVHLFWYEEEEDLWRLVFEGEVISKAIHYSGGHRQASYKCRDLTTYWDQAHQVFFARYYSTNTSIGESDAALFYGSNVRALEENRATIKGEAVAQVTLGNLLTDAFQTVGSLGEGFQSIFDHLARVNDYWIFSESRLKMRKKIFTVDNPTALRILKRELDLIGRDFSQSPVDAASTWEIVQILKSRMFYQLICNPAPAYFRVKAGSGEDIRRVNLGDASDVKRGLGNLAQYIIMPEIYLSQPPRCNVILPPALTSFNYHDDFTMAPTRTMAMVSSISRLGTDADVANLVAGKVVYAPSDVEPFIGQDGAVLTNEEKIRGFIPNITHVSPAEVPETISDEQEVDDLLEHIVNYQHWMHNYATRYAAGTGPFNPFLVAGFPAAVIDRQFGFVVGMLNQIVHNLEFRGEGLITTQFQMNLCRHASTPEDESVPAWKRLREKQTPEALFPDLERPGQSAWFDPAFDDGNIGENIYRPLLGYEDGGGIIRSETEGESRSTETMVEALQRIRSEHLRAPDESKENQAWSYAKREIATQYETFLAIGAEPADSEIREDIRDKKVGDPEDWAELRSINAPAYQNPGAESQDYEKVDSIESEEDAGGPFLTVRQVWARRYRTEVRQMDGVVNV